MPGIYTVNFEYLILELLPERLREDVTIGWLKAQVDPVRLLWEKFNVNRNLNEYYLAHNGQVCYMEAVLNDLFDDIDREIFISDPLYLDALYVYQEAEVKPVYIDLESEIGTFVIDDPDPVPLYTDSEVGSGAVDFIVNVPSDLVYDTYRMTALIDKYRLASKKNYVIETF